MASDMRGSSVGREESTFDESIASLAGNDFAGSLFLRSLDAIMVYDCEGLVRRANPAAERLMGATQAEFVETKLGDRLHPDEIVKAREAFDRALDDLTTEFDARLLRGDGSLFDAAIMFIPLAAPVK